MNMTPDQINEMNKNWYVNLHAHLSQLHNFLAMRAIPHSYDAEGCAEVAEVMEMVERLTDELPKPKQI